MKNHLTLRKFAAQINVSPGTISKALRPQDKYRLAAGTVAFIQKQAKKFNFNLPECTDFYGKRQTQIGFVCGAMLESCDHNAKREKQVLRRMTAANVDAAIYWPGPKPIKDFFQKNLTKVEQSVLDNTPCVFIGANAPVETAYRIHYPMQVEYGINTLAKGDTSITIDTTAQAVNIGENYIIGGSNGRGVVTGNSRIKFSGDAGKLLFTGYICGDSASGYFTTETGQRKFTKDVKGERALVFDDFNGEFNAKNIVAIDTLTFKNDAKLTFTNAIDLSDVINWNFIYRG